MAPLSVLEALLIRHQDDERVRMSVMKKLMTLITALFILFALAAPTATAQAPTPKFVSTGATDCNQVGNYGSRICFDPTTGYGPVMYVYTGTTSLYTAFGVSAPNVTFRGFVWSDAEHEVFLSSNYTATWHEVGGVRTYDVFTRQDGQCSSVNHICMTPAQNDLMKWFGNAGGYEFIVVN